MRLVRVEGMTNLAEEIATKSSSWHVKNSSIDIRQAGLYRKGDLSFRKGRLLQSLSFSTFWQNYTNAQMRQKQLCSTLLLLMTVSQASALVNIDPKTDSLFALVDQHFERNDTTGGFQFLDSVLHLYSAEDDVRSDILNEYGYYYYFLGKEQQSISYYEQSLALERAMSDTVTVIGRLRNIGMAYKALGQSQRALEYYLEALSLAEPIQRARSIASVCNSIGLLQYEMQQYKKAKEYYRVALNQWKYLKDTLRLAFVYNNIGQVYYDQSNYDSALQCYRQALQWKKQVNRPRTLPTTLYNLGNTYLALRQLDTAANFLNESYRLARIYDMKREMASASISLGELYLTEDQQLLARSYLDTTRRLLNRIDSRSIRLEYLRLEAQYHEKMAQSAIALTYQKQWAALRDSLFNEERLKVVKAQAEYTLRQEGQARENAELRASIAQSENEQQRRYTLAALLGGGFLAVVSVVLYRMYRSNRRIKNRNADLVREVHHRVKNNLQSISSLLSLQSRRLADENAKKAMNDTQLRIQSMALIHRQLYGDQLSNVNMHDYLKELSTQVLDSFGCQQVDFQLKLDEIMLNIDQAVPIGLITNEVISNSCKYAFPDHTNPALKMSFQSDFSESYQLLIHDNGPGFDLDIINNSRTFGAKLIKVQTDQLRGKLSYTNQNGTLFRLSVPKSS